MNVYAFTLGVLTLIFGSGGIAWTLLRDRSKKPVSRDDGVAVTVADALDPATRGILEALSKQIGEQASTHAKELAEVRGEVRTLREEVAEVRSILSRWRAYGADLFARWPEHRQQETPPALPEA